MYGSHRDRCFALSEMNGDKPKTLSSSTVNPSNTSMAPKSFQEKKFNSNNDLFQVVPTYENDNIFHPPDRPG